MRRLISFLPPTLSFFAWGILSGLLGGILLIYPLQFAFLENILPGLNPTGASWSTICLLAGALVTTVSSYKAVHCGTALRRRSAIFEGARAGLVAGIISYGISGAGAAAIYGCRLLFQSGLESMAAPSQYQSLVALSVSSLLRWTHLFLWGFVICGAVLGALGGVLAGKTKSLQAHLPVIHFPLLASGLALALLILSLSSWFFNLVEQQIKLPLSFWPSCTAGLVCLAWQFGALALLYRQRKQPTEPHRLPWAYSLGLISLLGALTAFLANPSFPALILPVLVALLGLSFLGLTRLLAHQTRPSLTQEPVKLTAFWKMFFAFCLLAGSLYIGLACSLINLSWANTLNNLLQKMAQNGAPYQFTLLRDQAALLFTIHRLTLAGCLSLAALASISTILTNRIKSIVKPMNRSENGTQISNR